MLQMTESSTDGQAHHTNDSSMNQTDASYPLQRQSLYRRHKVLFFKNVKLKTRGHSCSTCCETIVPVAILALLCIGAYYEVDEVYHDRIYDTFAIQDESWAKELTYIEERGQERANGSIHKYKCTQVSLFE